MIDRSTNPLHAITYAQRVGTGVIVLDAETYDVFVSLLTPIPESVNTTESQLRWNSCLRNRLEAFQNQFARG